jgi:hypothetical protein
MSLSSPLSLLSHSPPIASITIRMSSQSQSQSQSVANSGQVQESLTGDDEEEEEESDESAGEAADVADAVAEEDMTSVSKAKDALRKRHFHEKEMVVLTSRNTIKKITSMLWKSEYFAMASIVDDWGNFVSSKRLKQFPGLDKIHRYGHPAVCKICFDNPLKPLEKCVFSTAGWNPTNLETHVRGCHNKEEAPLLFTTKEQRMNAHIISAAGRAVTKRASASSVSTFVSKNNPEEALEEAHKLMYRFFNSANVSVRQGISPEFQNLLTYCVDNAASLKSQTDKLKLGIQRFRSEQFKSFSQTIYVVSCCIKMTQEWFTEATGSDDLPFINVAHDIWESKEKEYLGVSIHFMLPFLGRCVSFPIGLRRSEGHKSLNIVKECWVILHR